jgi:ATP synthase F1 delta subunit|tara:strand:- start:141 stop:734 length:594 start_codon:yes stop_codon:yes gene_type:complete
MSLTKKVVTTYSKSLFQNVVNFESSDNSKFDVTKIASGDKFVPDVFIIGEELLLIRSTLVSSKKLNEFFNNPTYEEAQKLDVLLNIFPGLTTTMKSFLKVLCERTHLALLPEICDEYSRILLSFKNAVKVKVITAGSLQENYADTLLSSLKSLTGSNEIILDVAYNPKLLGGLIVEYKSTAVDASILKEFSLFFDGI